VVLCDWFFHLFGLKSPREMRELDAQFRRDMRKCNLELARAIAEAGMTGEHRTRTLARIAEAEKEEGLL
jgi:hypothetical protein